MAAKRALRDPVKLLALGLGGLGVAMTALYWYKETWAGAAFVQDYYANAATSLLSIAVTVLLVDSLYERRQAEERKRQLIREMGSGDKGFALRAVKEISAGGWLSDGSIADCDLSQAALSGAHLDHALFLQVTFDSAQLNDAHMKGVRIDGGSYRRTIFVGATLDDAVIGGGADFIGAYFTGATLRDAKMPGVTLEETDFAGADLTKANLAGARLRRADLTNATLDGANLERANLADLLNWKKIKSMRGTRIAAIEDAPDGFREFALSLGAIGGAADIPVKAAVTGSLSA